jgi:hypothetical protein
MRKLLHTALAIAVLACAAVAPGRAGAAEGCRAPLEAWDQVELYLGRSILGGGAVTPADFRRFLAEVVTPRFPDGLTVLDAAGQFRDRKGRIVREPSQILILLVPDVAAVAGKIDAIVRAYKRRFRQESVLRVQSEACLAF